MVNPCTKLYHWATYYYQVIGKKHKEQVLLPEAVQGCIQDFCVGGKTVFWILGVVRLILVQSEGF